MNNARRIACAGPAPWVTLALVSVGCTIFENPSPRDISVRVTGGEGALVQVIYSKQFQAGVDETGATHLQIYQADTVLEVLPVDTVVNVEVEKRFFVQVATSDGSDLTVNPRVDIDGRNVVATSWAIESARPWRYAYLFNQQIARIVDVIF